MYARQEQVRIYRCLRDGAEGPAVFEDLTGAVELVLGWAVGRHDLHEGKEEGAIFVRGPLGSHGWVQCRSV